jgi:hypothetical protein
MKKVHRHYTKATHLAMFWFQSPAPRRERREKEKENSLGTKANAAYPSITLGHMARRTSFSMTVTL